MRGEVFEDAVCETRGAATAFLPPRYRCASATARPVPRPVSANMAIVPAPRNARRPHRRRGRGVDWGAAGGPTPCTGLVGALAAADTTVRPVPEPTCRPRNPS